MKIKIVSDGTSMGTKIVNADTGEDTGLVKQVQSITWSIDAKSLATVVMTLVKVPVEVVGDADLP
jgi:hypothetical protein